MRHCTTQALFWIMFMVAFRQVLSVADQQCEFHESKDTERCCIRRTIEEGYQPAMCADVGGMVLSQPCPANTYQSKEYSSIDFHMCENHSTCTSPAMVTVKNGTSTSNTVCHCNEADGYYDTRPDTTLPLESHYCIRRTAKISLSSLVHQSRQSTTSGYPADTSASTTASAHSIWTPVVIGVVAAFVATCIVAAVAVAVIICFRKKLKECCCNRGKNETAQLPSSNGVVNPIRMPHNGHVSDPNHAAETDAHQSLNLIENSIAQDEDENGSHMIGSLNLRSDYDNSSSLCSHTAERQNVV